MRGGCRAALLGWMGYPAGYWLSGRIPIIRPETSIRPDTEFDVRSGFEITKNKLTMFSEEVVKATAFLSETEIYLNTDLNR